MKSISKNLFVFANLEGEFVPAGKLTMEEEGSNLTSSSFAYGLRYLERKNALEIDPVSLSLRDKTKVKNISLAPQNGLEYFGGIRDASPDSWGRRVIEAKLRAPTNSLPESTYLLEAGSDRIGALDIRESLTALERPLQNTIHHLSYLLDGAARIEEGLPIPDALAQIFVAGSGLGGMRPKASIRDDENILWMAKFPGRTDSVADFPLIEFATMQLAKIAGLNVAETKLIKVQNKNVFLIKRFDRSWTNNPKPIEIRHHMLSALTFLSCSESESIKKSYVDIAEAIRRYCHHSTIKANLKELYARMVFNIFVTNDDDHLRNHAFLRDPKQGAWSLSPLYDVMPRAMFSTERFLHLGIGPEGRLATIDNAYASKEQFNISSRDALGIIDRIWRTVRQWKLHFEESGVSNNQIEIISKAFRHLNDITSPNLRQKLLTR